jgi:hypothetical protein
MDYWIQLFNWANSDQSPRKLGPDDALLATFRANTPMLVAVAVKQKE